MARGEWPPVGQPEKKSGWWVGSGLAGMHPKGAEAGQSLTISRTPLGLGGAVPPGSERPQMSKHQKHMASWVHLASPSPSLLLICKAQILTCPLGLVGH